MSFNNTANESILNNSIMNCSICLSMITDEHRCVAKDCMHQFCVGCLKRWLEINGKCPLCKLIVSSIIYNIKDDRDYKEDDIDQNKYDPDSDTASTIDLNDTDSNSTFEVTENMELFFNFEFNNFGGFFPFPLPNAITIDSDSSDESENDNESENANESENSNESDNDANESENTYESGNENNSPNSSNISMSPISLISNSSSNSTISNTTSYNTAGSTNPDSDLSLDTNSDLASVSSFDIDSDDNDL